VQNHVPRALLIHRSAAGSVSDGPIHQALDMDGELAREASNQGNIFLRSQALDSGYRSREIERLLRSGEWVRVRRGAYTTRETWEGRGPTGRYLLRVHAVVAALDGPVVCVGHTALARLQVPLWGVRFDEVHVRRTDRHASRREAGVVHHRFDIADHDIIEIDGLLVQVPELAALEAARMASFEAGVVLMDGARRLPGFDDERCAELLERQRSWPGSVRASRVFAFSDPRAATVGESRSRVLLARIGVPKPDLQHEVRDASGRLIGITDLYVVEIRTAVEFDGRVKYGRQLYEKTGRLEDVDLGAVVWNEKRREDQIRDEGNEMVRIVWHELDGHDREVRARFDRAAERAGSPLLAS
jgi:hypothetical protein